MIVALPRNPNLEHFTLNPDYQNFGFTHTWQMASSSSKMMMRNGPLFPTMKQCQIGLPWKEDWYYGYHRHDLGLMSVDWRWQLAYRTCTG
jgi:hypothetical protein